MAGAARANDGVYEPSDSTQFRNHEVRQLATQPRAQFHRPPAVGTAVSVSAVARLFRLARSRHTLRGWLRYRLALLFAPQPDYRAFVAQARRRYYTLTQRR